MSPLSTADCDGISRVAVCRRWRYIGVRLACVCSEFRFMYYTWNKVVNISSHVLHCLILRACVRACVRSLYHLSTRWTTRFPVDTASLKIHYLRYWSFIPKQCIPLLTPSCRSICHLLIYICTWVAFRKWVTGWKLMMSLSRRAQTQDNYGLKPV
jgi:hypothetical protein